MTDLHAELAAAQKRVSELSAQIERERIEVMRARLRQEQGEVGWELYAAIGSAIKAQRNRAGLSQRELGEVVGVLRTSITNIEKGRQRLPLDLLYDIADALGVQAVSLLPRNEDV